MEKSPSTTPSSESSQNSRTDMVSRLTSLPASIVLLIVVASITRLSLLFRDYPLSFDDGVYAMSIQHVSRGHQPFNEVFSSQGPFFLTLVSIPSQLFSESFWSFRLINFLCGILAALFTLVIARRFTSPSWSLVAALIVAASGTVMRVTTPITSDGVLVAAALGCVLLTYRFADEPTYLRSITLGLAVGFACGIKSVFMLPTLIFILVVTWKTPWKLRILAAGVSIALYAVPFVIFGVSNTLEQSLFYHLDKSDKLSLRSNLSKIASTLSSFDTAVFVLGIVVTLLGIVYIFTSKYFSRVGRTEFRQRIFSTHTPYSFFLFFVIPTLCLVAIQAPLFRNHLAILIPGLAIYTCWGLMKFSSLVPKRTQLLFISTSCIFFVVAAGFSIQALYTDQLIAPNPSFDAAVTELSDIRSDGLILTNEPGIAWAAHLGVPVGFEDTSRYRFLSQRKNIKLNEKIFRKQLSNNKVCAIVHSPEHNPPVIDWNEVAPSSWTKVHDETFIVWINPRPSCQR